MKAILYLEGGYRQIVDYLTPPHRRERETQAEYEDRVAKDWNRLQPNMVHKVTRVKLMRN